jgi:hypothetical protein
MVFDETTVRALFSRTEVTFEPSAMSNKLKELMEKVAGLPSDNQKLVYKSFLKEKVLKVSTAVVIRIGRCSLRPALISSVSIPIITPRHWPFTRRR